MSLAINSRMRFKERAIAKNGVSLEASGEGGYEGPEDVYRRLQFNYPKFFKMDLLCKWAWLGAECLLNDEDGSVLSGMDRNRVAVVLGTSKGCLDVDKRYRQTVDDIPSPALFVYTLPNIMLGEICIRHGFKGEQMCLVSERFDPQEIGFWTADLLERRNMDACLCGWVDAAQGQTDVCMYWVSRKQGVAFSAEALEHFYDSLT